MDLGDVWATHLAHFKYGALFANREQNDWDGFCIGGDPLPMEETLEDHKAMALFCPEVGTDGACLRETVPKTLCPSFNSSFPR